MTLEQILTIAERVGIPVLILIGILYFTIRYVWPFITGNAWPFLVGLVETSRKERIEEREKFLAAINRLVDERDEERAAFIESMRQRDEKLADSREVFMTHLRERDDKFAPVVAALDGLAQAVSEIHLMVDERTSAISIGLGMVQKQVADLLEIARSQ